MKIEDLKPGDRIRPAFGILEVLGRDAVWGHFNVRDGHREFAVSCEAIEDDLYEKVPDDAEI